MVNRHEQQINAAISKTKTLLPTYKSRIVDPIEALRTGEANCAIRSFFTGVILESFDLKPLYIIHSYHVEDSRQEGLRYGYTHNVLGDIAIVSTVDPDRIEISDYDEKGPWYIGATILGTSVEGLMMYAHMHPELPDLTIDYLENAKNEVISRV
jgi:hypothetical protein